MQPCLANFWLHGYFLEVDQGKMAKSSGEFLRLKTLTDRNIDPLAYRYLCLTANYRSDLKFNWNALESSATALNRLRKSVSSWKGAGEPDPDFMERFRNELYQDLNTAKALAVVWELCRSGLPEATRRATVLQCDAVLGLDLAGYDPCTPDVPAEVSSLVERREVARTSRDWNEADRLRAEILDLGYELEDSPNGTRVTRRQQKME